MFLMNMMTPQIPMNNMKPPTIYALLQSAVNFENPNEVKIKDLAKNGRHKIFNFDYPLSSKLDKEKFECMILNHFIQRRIGFQTLTAFQIQLDVKLNEIMPIYNKMFDSIDGWNIFEDGEKSTHKVVDERTSDNVTTAKNTLKSNSKTSGENTSDNRHSDLPQTRIDNVKDGTYISDYGYNTDKNNSSDESSSDGTSDGTSKTTDKHTLNEEWTKSPADKLAIYKEFQENIKSIYGMIFKDLECLFYQLI